MVRAGMLLAILLLVVGAARADDALRSQARTLFGPLPEQAADPANPVTPEKIDLGRKLFYETRLSKNHDLSCNSCHPLDAFGVDGEKTSAGHAGQRGVRNAPTVYNAALHFAQFWDGRAADVEEQAKVQVLNPLEMAMPDEIAVVAVLRSIPDYAPLFRAAFPGDDPAITYDNMARAIAAFERRLTTPAPFDRWLAGDDAALSAAQQEGLRTFVGTGCPTCHSGPAFGGATFQKLGLVEPYPTRDHGRKDVTGRPADESVFKVPSLRNVVRTGPWLHDGSIDELDMAILVMARFQLGRTLTGAEARSIAAFLDALTGTVDGAYVARPQLPASGPDTPAPDPGVDPT